MRRANYRKIYKDNYGNIPVDDTGRSFDIHHIDGNHTNNDPSNLQAVSIQDHYDIHYAHGDYGACSRIAARLALTHEQISILSSLQQQALVNNGTHHFLGGKIQCATSTRMVTEGVHPFLNRNLQSTRALQRVKDGTHHFVGGKIQRNNTKRMIDSGTHNFITNNPTHALMKAGTHHFITNNPSNIKITCPYCGLCGSKANMLRWHFGNCKTKENRQ